jgi:hypothetical protein
MRTTFARYRLPYNAGPLSGYTQYPRSVLWSQVFLIPADTGIASSSRGYCAVTIQYVAAACPSDMCNVTSLMTPL